MYEAPILTQPTQLTLHLKYFGTTSYTLGNQIRSTIYEYCKRGYLMALLTCRINWRDIIYAVTRTIKSRSRLSKNTNKIVTTKAFPVSEFSFNKPYNILYWNHGDARVVTTDTCMVSGTLMAFFCQFLASRSNLVSFFSSPWNNVK